MSLGVIEPARQHGVLFATRLRMLHVARLDGSASLPSRSRDIFAPDSNKLAVPGHEMPSQTAKRVDEFRASRNNSASYAPVAQLDRVPGYELGGREFESLRARLIREGAVAPFFLPVDMATLAVAMTV